MDYKMECKMDYKKIKSKEKSKKNCFYIIIKTINACSKIIRIMYTESINHHNKKANFRYILQVKNRIYRTDNGEPIEDGRELQTNRYKSEMGRHTAVGKRNPAAITR